MTQVFIQHGANFARELSSLRKLPIITQNCDKEHEKSKLTKLEHWDRARCSPHDLPQPTGHRWALDSHGSGLRPKCTSKQSSLSSSTPSSWLLSSHRKLDANALQYIRQHSKKWGLDDIWDGDFEKNYHPTHIWYKKHIVRVEHVPKLIFKYDVRLKNNIWYWQSKKCS